MIFDVDFVINVVRTVTAWIVYISAVYTQIHIHAYLCADQPLNPKRHFFRCAANKEIWHLEAIRGAGSFRVNSTNFDKSSQVSVSNIAQKIPKITLVSIMKACQILGGNSEYFWRYSLSNFLFCFAFLPSRL